jgi:AraC family transcriptional regulator, positive regulator of tynA and feaB
MNISSGDLSLYHGTRTSLLHVNETIEAIVCNIPLKYFNNHIKQPEELHGTMISARSPLGSLASSYFLSLATRVGQLSNPNRRLVMENFLQLLSIAMEHTDPIGNSCMEVIQTSIAMQIKEFILCNLANQELCPELIAAKFRISQRYLYNIFNAEQTTPCQFILDERLNSARQQLLNQGSQRKNVSEIAFDAGFNNVSHFCRQFKRKFQATPSELRSEPQAFAD